MHSVKSLKGNTCAQIYANEHIVTAHPIPSKAHAGDTLLPFVGMIGLPNVIITDGAAEEQGRKSTFVKTANYLHIQLRQTEPYTPRQNKVERRIGELRRRYHGTRARTNMPRRIWDFALVREAEVLNIIARGDGRTGLEHVTGETPDISEYLDFGMYEPVWYWDVPGDDDNPKLGRWLGVSHKVGSDMCYWVLKENGHVLSRTSVQRITELELKKDDIKARLEKYDAERVCSKSLMLVLVYGT